MRSMAFILWLAFIGMFAIPTKGQEPAPCRNKTNYLKQQDMQKTISLRKAFSLLQKAHHIHIVYDEALVKGKTLPSKLQVSNNLSDDLWRILRKYSLTFEVVGENTIVIMPRHQTKKGVIKGKITNEHGEGIAGAQVIIEGTTFGAAANLGGEYRIVNLPPGTYTLRTKVIGYHPKKALIQVRANKIVHKDFSLAPDVIQMDEVVVTATLNPSTRRESSIAITTKTLDQINTISPRSTADLLRVIPGFYVESSGGEVGGNLFVRGLPADGSYYYVALMEDGMPVYDAPALSFVNADIFVRVDENIERMEAVRGGNSALFGINAPGGVINFINKSGGNQLSATLKTTVGTGGLARYDFNLNGPLGNLWRFNAGGFFRYDNGVRNPGFPASKGGQIKGNLTCFFKKGYVKFYGKYLNDSNIFYLQLPFKSGRALKFVDGFPHNGTLTTFEGNGVQVPTPGAGSFTIPLGDGQKQVGGSLMAKFNFEFPDGWNLQNTIRYMSINQAWNALLPFNLVNAGDFAQNYVNRTPG
ncbi:MAG TPA: hypothetical protein ENH53_07605, partial [Bacteroidetes bacterium]|nr:hypothetical protein [Bacteroidota bacterium]